jgi:hypothetical protein
VNQLTTPFDQYVIGEYIQDMPNPQTLIIRGIYPKIPSFERFHQLNLIMVGHTSKSISLWYIILGEKRPWHPMEEYQSEISYKVRSGRTVSVTKGLSGETRWPGRGEGGLLGYNALWQVSILSSLAPSPWFENTLNIGSVTVYKS